MEAEINKLKIKLHDLKVRYNRLPNKCTANGLMMLAEIESLQTEIDDLET